MSQLRPFHLAFPVDNLDAARKFWGETMGCPEGRSSDQWIDFDFYGHQIVAHLAPGAVAGATQGANAVDGHDVPVPHFGIVLTLEDWHALADRLAEAGTKFEIELYVRFAGQPGEQATMFFRDPAGNAIEMKAFADLGQLRHRMSYASGMTLQRMMPRIARWHIWLGWIVALPLLMWAITGLVMVARPIGTVRGEALQAKPAAIDSATLVLPKLTGPIEQARLVSQPDGPVWLVTEQGGGTYRYSARDGSLVPPVIEAEARQIAQAAYAGKGKLAQVTFIPADAAPVDLRRKLNAWQAQFDDGTRVYIDDATGEVLAFRTGWWRFYDFMYGLHIMDPASRADAHNPFAVVLGTAVLAGALLGTILLFRRRKARVKA